MDGTYGFISVVPVIVLIVVTLLTKRTFESLLLATVLAMIIGYRGEWFTAFINQLQAVTAGNIWVLLVVGLLGGIAMAQRVSAPFLRKVIGALCIGLGAFLFLRQAGCF